jgi:predicted DNA-binding mobile mystery protein A
MMSNLKLNIKRVQLADLLRVFPSQTNAIVPRGGWIRAIREALGMTQTHLATRAGISRQSIQDFELAEADRRITLESLDRVAKSLGCRLVYALVPEKGSLDTILMNRAEILANSLLKSADHSMGLEAQGVSASELKRRRKQLVESLLNGNPRELW